MTAETINRLYNVTIKYTGTKKVDKLSQSAICLTKDGVFLVMDSDGNRIRFAANNCKVDQIAANLITVHGFTDRPLHITAYCIYAAPTGGPNE